MADIIYLCADKAVDFIRRLPLNEATAIAYHTPVAQRQVLARFRKFVAMKKDHERKRITGIKAVNFDSFMSSSQDR